MPGVAEEALAMFRCLSWQEKLWPSANGVGCSNGGREYPMLRWFESGGRKDLRKIGEPIAIQRTDSRTSMSELATLTREVAQCVE